MNAENLFMKKIYIITSTGIASTTAVALVMLYIFTKSVTVVVWGLLFSVIITFWFVVFYYLIRRKLTFFSGKICGTLDDMIKGNLEPSKTNEEETLLAKINYRLIRLYESMMENNHRVAKEKIALQELVSDISHQLKTPIANLKIVNATLLEQKMSEDKKREFLQSVSGQLDKLDFLMQAMIKLSRLETGVITLLQNECSIYETLAVALGGILFSAESKNINIKVNCSEGLSVCHDSKWTAEALFNIIDNAVKYTSANGTISINVVRWEMYTKIDIKDNGRGVSESRQAEIFKRFYREEEVHNIEGIGIGLYLAREIITMQGGYIKVTSEVGKGSVFSVFLPNI